MAMKIQLGIIKVQSALMPRLMVDGLDLELVTTLVVLVKTSRDLQVFWLVALTEYVHACTCIPSQLERL